MLKIENYEVMGWEHAIRGMRNPMNSWEQSDSFCDMKCSECSDNQKCEFYFSDFSFGRGKPYRTRRGDHDSCVNIGPNDQKLMKNLREAGTDHRKYMRMLTVYLDITAPLYWWKEFDTYKVGTVANSCSTMHKIHDKEFTLEDFSTDHLIDDSDIIKDKELRENLDVLERKQLEGHILVNGEHDLMPIESIDPESNKESVEWLTPVDILEMYVIGALNFYREKYLKTKDKKYWWQMIQLLPSSYNQKRTVMLNYEVLANIYKSRRNHKLDEWHVLCDWIEKLPYAELITGKFEKE